MNHRLKALLLIISGLICAAALSVFLFLDRFRHFGAIHFSLLIVLGIASFLLLTFGINVLLSARSSTSEESRDYRHAYPVFIITGVVFLSALGLRELVVPTSYGQLGSFRADALQEAASFSPQFTGNDSCRDCHADIIALCAKDVHSTVQCEVCHGAGLSHISDQEIKMIVSESVETCLVCHQMLDARPGDFPQIDKAEHYAFVGVRNEGEKCITCHSAHEPLFMDKDIRSARNHPLIHRCRDCHISRMDESRTRPDRHPFIFECSYCHSDIVQDFQQRNHAGVQCTTCHLFIKNSDYSGKIIKDSDPRFCLLCHRDGDYRSPGGPAKITWPGHLQDLGEGRIDAGRHCIDCHRENVHLVRSGADHD
jgi:hypothetical protein